MKKNDGKDKYRKKKYTRPKKTPRLNKVSTDLKKNLEWELEFIRKAELQGYKPDKSAREILIDLANNGVNIFKIARALASIPSKWKAKTGTFDMTMDLSGKRNELKYNNAIENTFKLLTERLEPVFSDCNQGQNINREITKMQSELIKYEWTIKEYLNLRLYELYFEEFKRSFNYTDDDFVITDDEGFKKNVTLGAIRQQISPDKIKEMIRKKIKPAIQSTHKLWDKAIYEITAVLINSKIYSNNESYAKTAELLHLYYPEIYKDKDPNLVRQRYAYHRKKLTTK